MTEPHVIDDPGSGELTLFPDLVAAPESGLLAGLGRDARATIRRAELIAAGVNPGTRLPLHRDAARKRDGEGLRCSDCAHLYRTGAGNSAFLKCREAGVYNARGSWGPDMRGWWPACRVYEPQATNDVFPPTYPEWRLHGALEDQDTIPDPQSIQEQQIGR